MTMTANPHHAEMDLDEQEHLFFGHLGPVKRDSRPSDPGALPASLGTAKRQRVDQQDKGKGRGGKGKGKAKGKGSARQQSTTQPVWAYNDGSGAYQSSPWTPERSLPPLGEETRWGTSRAPHYDNQERLEWMENRVQRLTQLALRQEQLLANVRQDMVLYLFVRSGDTDPRLQSRPQWRCFRSEAYGKLKLNPVRLHVRAESSNRLETKQRVLGHPLSHLHDLADQVAGGGGLDALLHLQMLLCGVPSQDPPLLVLV